MPTSGSQPVCRSGTYSSLLGGSGGNLLDATGQPEVLVDGIGLGPFEILMRYGLTSCSHMRVLSCMQPGPGLLPNQGVPTSHSRPKVSKVNTLPCVQ